MKDIRGGKAMLEVQAPKDMLVIYQETYDRLMRWDVETRVLFEWSNRRPRLAIGEKLRIGDHCTITLLDLRASFQLQARLEVDVPAEVPVYRQEVYDVLRKEKR